jgi:hypothetical protein
MTRAVAGNSLSGAFMRAHCEPKGSPRLMHPLQPY